MLTYSPSLRLVNALKNNNLPILLANVQPENFVSKDWDMKSLTINQGIHGMQDTANILFRMGIKPCVISEDWNSHKFRSFVTNWSFAAKTARFLQNSRLASMGQMPGMGDILVDSALFMDKIGPQIDQINLW